MCSVSSETFAFNWKIHSCHIQAIQHSQLEAHSHSHSKRVQEFRTSRVTELESAAGAKAQRRTHIRRGAQVANAIHSYSYSYVTLRYITLRYVTLHCITLHYVYVTFTLRLRYVYVTFTLRLRCIALHCIALHCVALDCIALHCVALRCVTLRYVTRCSGGSTRP